MYLRIGSSLVKPAQSTPAAILIRAKPYRIQANRVGAPRHGIGQEKSNTSMVASQRWHLKTDGDSSFLPMGHPLNSPTRKSRNARVFIGTRRAEG